MTRPNGAAMVPLAGILQHTELVRFGSKKQQEMVTTTHVGETEKLSC